MSSGSSSASERVHRHTTTTLNAVFAAKCPGAELQVEDIHWWSNGQKFSAATGRPWRCDECRSKSCCYCQAFDQISYAEATSPHHVFKTQFGSSASRTPPWKRSSTSGSPPTPPPPATNCLTSSSPSKTSSMTSVSAPHAGPATSTRSHRR